MSSQAKWVVLRRRRCRVLRQAQSCPLTCSRKQSMSCAQYEIFVGVFFCEAASEPAIDGQRPIGGGFRRNLIADVGKCHQALQFVITIRPFAEHMQVEIDLGRSGFRDAIGQPASDLSPVGNTSRPCSLVVPSARQCAFLLGRKRGHVPTDSALRSYARPPSTRRQDAH